MSAGRPAREVARGGGRRWRAALLIIACLASLVYGVVGAWHVDAGREGERLWDLRYYRLAAGRWQSGLDPYLDGDEPTGYYYPPAVTPLLAAVAAAFEAVPLYAAAMTLATAAALALAVAAVRPPPDTRLVCWLYALAFGNSEVAYLLVSGNLAWVPGLGTAAALWAASRGRWPLFYLLIGLASLIKPYTLLLLVVPVALRRTSALAALALLPLTVEAVISWRLWPELGASRLAAIRAGVIEPLQLRYSFAGSLSGILTDRGLDAGAATLLAALSQAALVLALVLTLRRRPPADARRGLALAAVAAVAAYPRMAGYDAFVFGPAVFVAFLPSIPGRGAAASGPVTAVRSAALLLLLLKEGLVLLPVLALAAVALAARGRGRAPAPTVAS